MDEEGGGVFKLEEYVYEYVLVHLSYPVLRMWIWIWIWISHVPLLSDLEVPM